MHSLPATGPRWRAVWLTALISLVVPVAVRAGMSFTRITEGPVATDAANTLTAAWGDYDGDGFPDLIAGNGLNGPEANGLYHNNRDGTFTRIDGSPVVTDAGNTRAALWADYDNDGRLDLCLANCCEGGRFLYHNEGNGVFARAPLDALQTDPGYSHALAWGDYDGDGWLDLVVGNYGGALALYHNQGDGTFRRVTTGIVPLIVANALSASWVDYDDDGDLDLFVVTDTGQNDVLLRNDADGWFTVAPPSSINTDAANGGGHVWADFDNDGDLDLFVARWGQANAYHRNNGDGTFTAVTEGPWAGAAGYSVGVMAGDFDNDGDLDLVVANANGQPESLYENQGDGTFVAVADGPVATAVGESRAVAVADYDRDGDLDVYISNQSGVPGFLFRNEVSGRHWLEVRCLAAGMNRDALGAKVRVLATIGGQPRWQRRDLSSGGGYPGNGEWVAHFGLAEATTAATVRIEWPSGRVQTLNNVAVDQLLTVTEAAPTPVIRRQPAGMRVLAGQAVTLEIRAAFTGAGTYQWRFNGAPVAGATNATLRLGAVRLDQAGEYTCLVSDATGSQLSRVARVVMAERADIGFGTGRDGDLVVTNQVELDGLRHAVAGLNPAGSLTLQTDDSSGFTVGDEVLLITMIDAVTVDGNANTAGLQETRFVVAVNDTRLTLDRPLSRAYDAIPGRAHQVIRVPHFASVTVEPGGVLTCSPWDGLTGGVLVFRAADGVTVQAGGRITAAALGYRGGPGSGGMGDYGLPGESYAGSASARTQAANQGGGGGGGVQYYAPWFEPEPWYFGYGGGGGGYGTPGGGSNGAGGAAYGEGELTRWLPGSGGGAGGKFGFGGATGTGGSGGGVVAVFTPSLQLEGTLDALGGAAAPPGGTSYGKSGNGGSGGGAGGSVVVRSLTSTLGSNLTVSGGAPSGNAGAGSGGAWGGGGRIRIESHAAPGNLPPGATYESLRVSDRGDLVIAEVMYCPAGGPAALAEQYVELHNRASVPVSLAGWSLQVGAQRFELGAGATVAAGGQLVLARDLARFAARYGAGRPVTGPLGFGLSTNAATLVLNDASGRFVTAAHYEAAGTYPVEAAGGGASLELLNPDYDPLDGRSWAASAGAGSPGTVNATKLRLVSVPRGYGLFGGETLQLGVDAVGAGGLAYQWRRDGVALAGQTNATLTLTDASAALAGVYTVAVSSAGAGVTSPPAAIHITQLTRLQTGAIAAEPVGSYGGAWGDYDQDGRLDLVAANYGGLDEFLFHNNGNGSFTRITTGPLVTSGGSQMAAAWGDYDNDGRLDLALHSQGEPDLLYHNEGGGNFRRVTGNFGPPAGPPATGMAWVDYDRDGFLDLFLARPGQTTDVLLHNLGDGTFAQVLDSPLVTGATWSHGVAWGDYDGDGNEDLFVATYNQPDLLYHNEGNGTFRAVTEGPIVGEPRHSTAGAWGDYDNDGDLDLFVAGFGGSPSYLYRNEGHGQFTRLTDTPMSAGTWEHFAAGWGDFDNDGDLDLLVLAHGQPDQLFRNRGDGTFVAVGVGDLTQTSGAAQGLAVADYDRDGDLDVVVFSSATPNLLFRNGGAPGAWLEIAPVTATGRAAVGAKVRVTAVVGGTSRTMLRVITANGGIFGNGEPSEAHFGLADAGEATSVRVEFPSGAVRTVNHVGAFQRLEVVEDSDVPVLVAQALNDRALAAGEPVTLRVQALGSAPLQYQWRREGAALVGATNATLTLTSPGPLTGGAYDVVVRNALGAVTSHVGHLSFTWQSGFVRLTGDPVADGAHHSTLAWTDFDGDGWPDVALVSSAGRRLFRNLGGGHFAPVTGTALDEPAIPCGAPAWGDCDNDGRPDLIVASGQGLLLYRNLGGGAFAPATVMVPPGGPSYTVSMGWVDYNRDGWLDLGVANAVNQRDLLYRNQGDGTFAIDSDSLAGRYGDGWSHGLAWGDYDDDGWPDLFLANGLNQICHLFHNERDGTLRWVEETTVRQEAGNWLGDAWADIDNDGDLDLIVTRYEGAGSVRLYRNDGGTFTAIPGGQLAEIGAPSWSPVFADFDNDGDLDLFIAVNGYASELLWNDGQGGFRRDPGSAMHAWPAAAFGAAAADFDRDGQVDLLVVGDNSENLLFRNQGNAAHWLVVQPLTSAGAPAIGATVRVTATLAGVPVTQRRDLAGGGAGYSTQDVPEAHFGLSDAPVATRVRVQFPSGDVRELTNVPVNQIVTVREPNDRFNARRFLRGSERTDSSSSLDATKEPGEPSHDSFGGKSLWWEWVPSVSGPAFVSTLGSDFDTILGVYTGSRLDDLTVVGTDDEGNGDGTSRVDFLAVAGMRYLIAVDGYNATVLPEHAAAGEVVLRVSANAPPAIEWVAPAPDSVVSALEPLRLCAAPWDVEGYPVRVDYFADGGWLGSATNAPWCWDWVTPPVGTHTVWARTTDNGGLTAESAPVELLVVLDNDTLAGRIALFGLTNHVTGLTAGATAELGEPAHAGVPATHSVWYSWTAPITGRAAVRVAPVAGTPLLAVYAVPGAQPESGLRGQVFTNRAADQTFVVPASVSQLAVKLWGAGGFGSAEAPGGAGGFTTGLVQVIPGETLTLVVGEGGQPSTVGYAYGGGGYNPVYGWQGGGRTALRRGGVELLTAGGGGAGGSRPGGSGGGLAGLPGGLEQHQDVDGWGGTQSGGGAGGAGLQGDNPGFAGGPLLGGVAHSQQWSGVGGGGGWFGGGAGGHAQGNLGAAGGGSGYTGGPSVLQGATWAEPGPWPPGTNDVHYAAPVGHGSLLPAGGAGGPGLAVLTFDDAPLQALSPIASQMGSPDALVQFNVTAGVTYLLAIDSAVGPGSFDLDLVASLPPTAVTLTAPSGGALFVAPAVITNNASASDVDGTVARVDFYGNGQWLGSDLTKPYQYIWSGAAVGNYTLTAVATDNLGFSSTSAPVVVNVLAQACSYVPATNQLAFPAIGGAADLPLAVNQAVCPWTASSSAPWLTLSTNRGVGSAVVRLTVAANPLGASRTATLTIGGQNVSVNQAPLDLTRPTASLAALNLTNAGSAFHSLQVTYADNVAIRVASLNSSDIRVTGPNGYNVLATLDSVSAGTDGTPRTATYRITSPAASWHNGHNGTYTVALEAGQVFDINSNAAVGAVLGTFTVAIANVPPVVALTQPGPGAVFTPPAAVALAAAASDADGAVAQVEFLVDGALVAVDNTAPFTANWTDLVPGSHTLAARATDSRGDRTTSAPVAITVLNPRPPTDDFAARATLVGAPLVVTASSLGATKEPGEPNHAGQSGGSSIWWTWTAPAAGRVTLATTGTPFDTVLAVYTGTAVSGLTFVASDDDGGGAGTSRLTFDAAAGTAYQIAVDSFDGSGGDVTLSLQLNRLPTVGLTSPVTGTTGLAPASFTLGASASDPDGTIALVSFHQGTNLLGVTTNAPYRWDLTGLPAGGYEFTARAVDQGGLSVTSAVVLVNVVQPLPPNDAFATATILAGANATVTGFNTLATKEPGEPAHAGKSGGHSVWWRWTAPVAGRVTLSTDGSGFDTLLAVYTGASVSALSLVAQDDDSGGAGTSRVTFDTPAGLTYLIAVDGYGSTGDIRLALALNALPSVSLTEPGAGAPFTAPATVSVKAKALDADGFIERVALYQGGTLLALLTNAPYQFVWSGVAAGNYVLTAQAFDNLGAGSTSAPVNVAVAGAPVAPSFTVQPGSQSVPIGLPAEFRVVVAGTPPFTYQWRSNGIELVDSLRVSGVHADRLLIAAVQSGDAAVYSARVLNAAGEAISAGGNLTVVIPPVLTAQPASQTVAAGAAASLTVTALGTAPLSYLWSYNGSPLPTATNATLNLPAVSISHAGRYSVQVANAAGTVGSAEAVLVVTGGGAGTEPPSLPRDDFWIVDGEVRAIVATNGVLYLGGDFTSVGPNTGAAAAVDTGTGLPDLAFPRVLGSVETVIADGAGGWFLGGAFTAVGGVNLTNLARIRPDRTVDPGWAPQPNGPVLALALAGDTLYVGGQFSRVAGQVRSNLAAVGVSSATLTAWALHPNNSVTALVTDGSTLYLGGAFTALDGGRSRKRLAAVSLADGTVTAWKPDADRTVFALALGSGVVYAGGEFTQVAGVSRSRLAAVDTATATATPFDPGPNHTVRALSLWQDALYAGGLFTEVSGQPRSYAAAIDTQLGVITPWDPAVDNVVYAIAARPEGVYLGGVFLNVAGEPRDRLARVEADTGAVAAWDPRASGRISALAGAGGTLLAGGEFRSVGGVERRFLAALDAATGAALPWNPGADDAVNALGIAEGGLWVGGAFTSLAGQACERLGAVDLASGALLRTPPGANDDVYAFGVHGGTLLAGGRFTALGGTSRANLAALDAGTGALLPWQPPVDGPVFAVATDGTVAYVGGDFFHVAGQTRQNLAALRLDTGALLPWRPDPNARVRALLLRDGLVYAGGFFDVIGLQSRLHLAALDAAGDPTAWQPVVASTLSGSATASAFASSEEALYLGGLFNQVAGEVRPQLAGVNRATAAATAWNPNANGEVLALLVAGNTLYAGGAFTAIGGQVRPGFAAFTVSGAPIVTRQPHGQVIAAGDTVTLDLTAAGEEPMTYQWYRNSLPLAGATNTQLTLAPVTLADAGTYRVVVTNAAGQAVSADAVLAWLSRPGVVVPPASQRVPAGATVQFLVQADGSPPLTYQWQRNGANLPGRTEAQLVLHGVSPADGGDYRVLIANAAGLTVSPTASLEVTGAGEAILVDAFSQRASVVSAAGTVTGSNVGYTREAPDEPDHAGRPGGRSAWLAWRPPASGIATVHTLGSSFDTLLAIYTGEALASLVPQASDEDGGGFYASLATFNVVAGTEYQIAVDGFGGAAGNIVLNWYLEETTDDVPRILTPPQPVTANTGDKVTLTVVADSLRPLGYQWHHNGEPVAGATAASYVIAALATNDVGPYYVRVNNPTRSVVSGTVVVEIGPAANVNTEDKLGDLTGGGNGVVLLSSRDAGGVALASPPPSVSQPGTQVLDNFSATLEQNEPNLSGVAGGASRWFPLRVPASGTLVLDTLGSDIDTVLQVFSGELPDYARLRFEASDDDSAPDGLRSLIRLPVARGTYWVSVDGKNGVTGNIKLNWRFGIPPAITRQPIAARVAAGSPVTFDVAVSGSPAPNLQWRKDGLDLPRENSPALSITQATPGHAGRYTVLVSNLVGTVTSRAVDLIVDARPTITAEPADATVNAGQAAVFTVGASGWGTLEYQWYFNGLRLPGATAARLVRSDVTASDAGVYHVVVSSPGGSVASRAANLRLGSTAPIVLDQVELTPAGEFRFLIRATVGQRIVVQVSTDLRTWQEVWTTQVQATPVRFTSAGTAPGRFYRVTSAP